MVKVFLGGTCNESNWRNELISLLRIEHYNPVVPDWTPECQQEEIRQRQACDFCLYAITPRMTGVFSIAEAVDDSNKRPAKTILCVLEADGGLTFDERQLKSLYAVGAMVERNGGRFCTTLEACADLLNGKGVDEVWEGKG